MKQLLTLLFIVFSFSAFTQVEIDASAVDSTQEEERYIDYSNQLVLKAMTVVKQNNLELFHTTNKESLKLAPYGITSLGAGFNYKWLGLAIAFGLPASAQDQERYGKTTRFDFQLNVYSKKFVIDAILQQYNGFYIANPNSLMQWDSLNFPQRDSMQTLSLGAIGYYVFNHKKLSYKAAYVRNAVQKKSAGSFLLGGFYNIDYAGFDGDGKYAFVPSYFPKEVQDTFDIRAYVSRSMGISFGYTYTLVFWKRFFINLSLVPGVGAKYLEVVKSGVGKVIERGGAARFNGRLAMGYEGKHFMVGLTSNTTTGTLVFEDFEIKPSTSNVRFFIAKRFNVSRKK